MLEIENEKFESERREKDIKIDHLKNQTTSLNEKFLILKLDFEEKETKGQQTEGRLKEQLKEISDELVALKKKRNQIFIETLEEESKIRRNSIIEHKLRKRNSKKNPNEVNKISDDKNEEKIINTKTQPELDTKEKEEEELQNIVSIRVIGIQSNDIKQKENNTCLLYTSPSPRDQA